MSIPYNSETPANCRRGAPLGRYSFGRPANGSHITLRLLWVDRRGYDRGGAYWGRGPRRWEAFSDGLYWTCEAATRANAIAKFVERYPDTSCTIAVLQDDHSEEPEAYWDMLDWDSQIFEDEINDLAA